MIPPNPNYLQAAVLLEQLAACGVRRVVISPGARSTPLAWTAARMDTLTCYTLIDERSAAFFALGLSKADGVPAALICTSGTAAANYFPAVIEAAQSFVPLVVITADRPRRLRHCGAAQTIDQVRLYGNYPRFFEDLPEPAAELAQMRGVRATVLQAFAAATGEPRGPVHLNVPLDEPLAPEPLRAAECREIAGRLEAEGPLPRSAAVNDPPEAQIVALAERVDRALCGLIVAGPGAARDDQEAEAIFGLGKQLGWPILADIASGLRFLRFPVMPFYDIFLRNEDPAGLAPDVVLSFGAFPTSRVLNAYLERHRDAHTARIQPHAAVQDPLGLAVETVVGDVTNICRGIARRVRAARDSLLWDPFQRAATAVRMGLETPVETRFEAWHVQQGLRDLPDAVNLVLANSLSIRYADTFAAAEGRAIRVYAMRGANGIDGTISHAAGVAAASGRSTLLITGDLAFLHDLTGLAAATKFAPNLRILLLDNNGGGIFHFLPVREEDEQLFEAIHGTPHDLNLAGAAALFDLDWLKVTAPSELRAALAADAARPRVLEVRSGRETNHTVYQALIKRLSEEAARA